MGIPYLNFWSYNGKLMTLPLLLFESTKVRIERCTVGVVKESLRKQLIDLGICEERLC